MKRTCVSEFVLALSLLVGCGPVSQQEQTTEETDQIGEPLAAATAKGTIPAGLPARLTVGLFEDSGGTWMHSSGAKWDVRYRYFTKGWVNNWGWGNYDGGWGLGYLQESAQQGYIPAVQYYQLVGEAGGGEGQTLQKVQTAATMKSYFQDFKILLQRVKDSGKPAYVLLEADAFGFLEQQTGGNPNTYAAIADSGMPELAGLPNTVAGFGLAFLKLRNAVGANQAILGLHISAWGSGKDIAYGSATDPLGPEVDKAYGFLAPFGLAANVTGSTFDVLVGDPLDRDSGFYQMTMGQDRWWDASDSASISSKSFNRYAEFLRLWNQKSQKRWVLWQIPLGNSSSKNVYNNGNAGEGYKDNRAEYFFNGSTAHLSKFADAGVIALLFGAGAGGQASYANDTYSDGRPFIQNHAGAFLNAGGLAISDGRGGGSTPPGTGGATGSGGATSTGGATGSGGTAGTGGATSTDSSRYGFESGAQGWTAGGASVAGVSTATEHPFAGARSLKVTFNGGTGSGKISVAAPSTPRGAAVTFRVWVPAGSQLASVQPYVLQGAGGGWAWTGSWRAATSLTRGQWNTIVVQVPANAAVPLAEMGVEFTTSAGGSAAAYVDAVTW
jgi:hypothetical protein